MLTDLLHRLLLFVLYFPRATPIDVPKTSGPAPSFRVALVVLATCILHAIATIVSALVVVTAYPSHRQLCANVFGVIAAILSSIQYFPQIYTTLRLRRIGSLSIPMMCIQTPGSIVWVSSLAARLGSEGWSTWGVYLVTAILQGSLLVMAVYFEYIRPITPVTGENGVAVHDASENADEHTSSEESPLLGSR